MLSDIRDLSEETKFFISESPEIWTTPDPINSSALKRKRPFSEYGNFLDLLGSKWYLPLDQIIRYQRPTTTERSIFLNKIEIELSKPCSDNLILYGFIELKKATNFLLFEKPLLYNSDTGRYRVSENPKFTGTDENLKWYKAREKWLILTVSTNLGGQKLAEATCQLGSQAAHR